MTDTPRRYRYRSLFWPIALIGVGVFLLLGNLGVITPSSWYTLLQLWPLLLIAIGLDLVFGRQPVIGAVIAVGTLAVAVALLIAAPTLGFTASSQIKSGHFSEPLGNATQASIEVNVPSGHTTISSLADSAALVDANLTYYGDIDFSAQGDANKTVKIQQRGVSFSGWPFGTNLVPMRWDIGLNSKTPLALTVRASSGQSDLNLRDLKLSSLNAQVSSGDMNASLPTQADHYTVSVDVSSGDLDFGAAEGTTFDAAIRMSSGNVRFRVPSGSAVQLKVLNSSSGNVRVPSSYTRTADNGGERGTWESPDFGKSERRIVLTINNMSSGNFEIR